MLTVLCRQKLIVTRGCRQSEAVGCFLRRLLGFVVGKTSGADSIFWIEGILGGVLVVGLAFVNLSLTDSAIICLTANNWFQGLTGRQRDGWHRKGGLAASR